MTKNPLLRGLSAVHPGEILREDVLPALGKSKSEIARLLGVSRQTILQRVKRGELHAVHVNCGRRKGLRIQVPTALPDLFERQSTDRV